MSDKDFVEKAALKGLSRKNPKARKNQRYRKKVARKPKPTGKQPKLPVFAFQNLIYRKKVVQKRPFTTWLQKRQPKSCREPKRKAEQGQAFGFLALVLLLPLAVVGGLYAYNSTQTDDKKSVGQNP